MHRPKYGLGTIRRYFLSILLMCAVVFLITIAYLGIHSKHRFVVQDVIEMKMPKLKTGWNDIFERQINNKFIVTIGKTGPILTRPLREKGYTIVYVPGTFNQEDLNQCRPPDCIYLDPANQATIRLRILEYLPSNSYSRKMMGYLYAISHGANIIYTKHIYNHDSSRPSCKLFSFNTYTVMEYTLDKSVVKSLRKHDFNTSVTTSSVPWFIYYKHILRHRDCCASLPNFTLPCVKETKPVSNSSIKKSSRSETNVKDTFTVLDSSIASFKYVTFWGLIFHTFFGALGKVLIQRLLKEVGSTKNIPHGFTDQLYGDLPWKNEENTYGRIYTTNQLNNLHTILHKWECVDDKLFYHCIRDITYILKRKQLLDDDDIRLIKAWLDDLREIGYEEPLRTTQRVFKLKKDITTISTFETYENETSDLNIEKSAARPGQTTFSKYCPNMKLKNTKPVIEDIGVIITFNDPRYYSNIAIIESMYRGYFKHIIYCGPEINSFTRESTQDVDISHFIFIEAFKSRWFFFYECLMLAGQLNIEVDGFIQIGDDTLLNPWNLKTLPRNKLWLHKTLDPLNISMDTVTPRWDWWNHTYGKPAVLNSLEEIIHEASFQNENDTLQKYVETYMQNSDNLTYIYRQGCDFMYVPMAYMNEYIQIASIFLKHRVMVELAHSTIVMGLQFLDDMVIIEDGSLWSLGERMLSFMFYDKSKVFLHPLKLDYIKSSSVVRDFICNTYMVQSEKHLYK